MQFHFVLWNVFLQLMGHLATLTTLECYRIYFVLSLPLMSAIMENSAHCINCFSLFYNFKFNNIRCRIPQRCRILQFPELILVTADVTGLYPSIPHSEGLDILKKQCKNYPSKKVSTEDIGKMTDFVLKNNLFEFDSKFYKQISGTAIGTKCAPPYACIFMDHIETEFLKTQDINSGFGRDLLMIVFLYG